METSSDNADEIKANKIFKWLVALIVSAVGIYAIFLIVVTWPISVLSIEAAGTFGDSFGILTSLFSGIAFSGLIWTILLQKAELKLQRQELIEARRQSILTRLMTLTQNQIASYRAEVSSLKFTHIGSEDVIDAFQMIFAMTQYLEQMARGQDDPDSKTRSTMEDFLLMTARNVRPLPALIQGLDRCCKANRYLLLHDSLTVDEAQDIKEHMLSELPTGLLEFVLYLQMALTAYEEKIEPDNRARFKLFDPMHNLRRSCDSARTYVTHRFNAEGLESERKKKWLFTFSS